MKVVGRSTNGFLVVLINDNNRIPEHVQSGVIFSGNIFKKALFRYDCKNKSFKSRMDVR